jgi:hypothetical protein
VNCKSRKSGKAHASYATCASSRAAYRLICSHLLSRHNKAVNHLSKKEMERQLTHGEVDTRAWSLPLPSSQYIWLVTRIKTAASIRDRVFFKYNINVDIYICMSSHLYKYIYVHPISMNTFKRLSRFDIKFTKLIIKNVLLYKLVTPLESNRLR